jgi:hypothetical protein
MQSNEGATPSAKFGSLRGVHGSSIKYVTVTTCRKQSGSNHHLTVLDADKSTAQNINCLPYSKTVLA